MKKFLILLLGLGLFVGCGQTLTKEEFTTGKFSAFKKVVNKYKHFPDRLASGKEREQFNKELSTLQDEFSNIPFEPTQNRDEAKRIVNLFQSELEGRYSGQLYNELEAEVRDIVAEMIR